MSDSEHSSGVEATQQRTTQGPVYEKDNQQVLGLASTGPVYMQVFHIC